MNLCIIQARLGSTRFKNKIFQEINGKKIIEIIYKRVCKSKKIDKVIIATTNNKIDDKLVVFLKKKKIVFFRGSEKNVLDRYYRASLKFKGNNIIRITSDCPLISHDFIDDHIKIFQKKKLDVISSYLLKSFPIGISLSVCKFKILETAWKKAKSNYDKEHVMPFVYKMKNIKIKKTKNTFFSSKNKPRLTIDYPADLVTIKNVFKHFYPKVYFSWKDIMKLYHKNKKLFLSNEYIK
jgi:spore coat polysaccharide biosynthesis protein SpsF (cytidylyltransferase family)